MNPNNKRIAKNTLMLYFRMMLMMLVTLYTSRVVLEVLGVEDFGIYSSVGGVVAMFGLLTGSLRAAAQRFITYELGKKEGQQSSRIFSATVTVHLALALIIFILSETVGLWFLNSQLNIPNDRLLAANWVFHCSVLTFVMNLLTIPYNATIIAHERMSAFAYIGILEVFLSLTIALLIPYLGFDKLILYSLLLLCNALIIRYVYISYCKRHFSECVFRFSWDISLFKVMFSFAGWNFIGSGSGVLMTQGVNILLNIYWGVTVNAARGIANQVQSAVTVLISNFMVALNPQITKSIAAGENAYFQKLIRNGARYSYLLMYLLALPILLETKSILSIWLVEIPEYAVNFVRAAIIYSLIHCLSNPLVTSMLAHGEIKKYQLIVGGFQSLNFPFSLIALKLGCEPIAVYFFQILFEICCLISRLQLLRGMIGFEARKFITQVLFRIGLVSLLSPIVAILISLYINNVLLRLILVSLTSFVSVLIFTYFIGFIRDERRFFIETIVKLIKRIKYVNEND